MLRIHLMLWRPFKSRSILDSSLHECLFTVTEEKRREEREERERERKEREKEESEGGVDGER